MFKRQMGTVPSNPPASVSPKGSEGPAVSLTRSSAAPASPSPAHSVQPTTAVAVPTSVKPSPVPSHEPPPLPRPSPEPQPQQPQASPQSLPQQPQPQQPQPQPATQGPQPSQPVVTQPDQGSPTAQPSPPPVASQSVLSLQGSSPSPGAASPTAVAAQASKLPPSSSPVQVSRIATAPDTSASQSSSSSSSILMSSLTTFVTSTTTSASATASLPVQAAPQATNSPSSVQASSSVTVTDLPWFLPGNSENANGQQDHTAAIAAGVIGSLVFLVISVAAFIFYRKRGMFSKASWLNPVSRTAMAGAADSKSLMEYDAANSSAFVITNASGLEAGPPAVSIVDETRTSFTAPRDMSLTYGRKLARLGTIQSMRSPVRSNSQYSLPRVNTASYASVSSEVPTNPATRIPEAVTETSRMASFQLPRFSFSSVDASSSSSMQPSLGISASQHSPFVAGATMQYLPPDASHLNARRYGPPLVQDGFENKSFSETLPTLHLSMNGAQTAARIATKKKYMDRLSIYSASSSLERSLESRTSSEKNGTL
ncbi:hypothetical protein BC830DRAFT_1107666 [Chytriomyces sp. MP71]|nr:hypothetical protein BC830DRAFT_1107666 [Chytriomyces sp. MP71]